MQIIRKIKSIGRSKRVCRCFFACKLIGVLLNPNEVCDMGNGICEICGQTLEYYDSVPRTVRFKERRTESVKVPRFRCRRCGCIHRRLPDYILPYKQYEMEIIKGVLEGLITPDTMGYEDYPCETTMVRWRASQKLQGIL